MRRALARLVANSNTLTSRVRHPGILKRDFDDITSPDKAARRSSFCCYTDDNLNRFRTSSAGEEQRDDDTEAGTAALADHAQAGTAYKRFGVFFMQHQHASEA